MIIINPDVFTTTTITNEKENCIDEEQYTNKNRSRSNSSQLKRNHYYDNSDVNEYEDNDYEDNDNTNEYDENKYDDYDDKSDFENNSDFESSDENDEKKRLYKSKKQYGQKHRLIEEKFVKKDPIQINDVFIHIRDLYSEEILQIIYYTLVMIDKSSHQKQETKDAINYNTYIQGLNMVLQNTNTQIQHWIKKNILIT
jgi:hypothetical protein